MAKAHSKVEMGEETVRKLVDIARRLFSELGYSGVSAELIVKEAGVTRGALYHHFSGKKGIFKAVFIECERDISEQILEAARKHVSPKDRLIAGSLASLESFSNPSVRRIVIEDAPTVLGWALWRKIDAEYCFALLRGSIQSVAAAELLPANYSEEALSLVLSGAMNELVMWIADSEDAEVTLSVAKDTISNLLNTLVKTDASSSL